MWKRKTNSSCPPQEILRKNKILFPSKVISVEPHQTIKEMRGDGVRTVTYYDIAPTFRYGHAHLISKNLKNQLVGPL